MNHPITIGLFQQMGYIFTCMHYYTFYYILDTLILYIINIWWQHAFERVGNILWESLAVGFVFWLWDLYWFNLTLKLYIQHSIICSVCKRNFVQMFAFQNDQTWAYRHELVDWVDYWKPRPIQMARDEWYISGSPAKGLNGAVVFITYNEGQPCNGVCAEGMEKPLGDLHPKVGETKLIMSN